MALANSLQPVAALCGHRLAVHRPFSTEPCHLSTAAAVRARPTPPARHRLRSAIPTAAAASSSSTAAGGFGATAAERLPESREEAVQQAATAIAAQLGGGKKAKAGKGFSGPGGLRLGVEVPDADTSAAGTLALAQDIVAALPRKLGSAFTVVVADEGAAGGAGRPGGAPVVSLRSCLASGRALGGCLLIVGAKQGQISDVQALLAAWGGPGAVLLNAEWDAVAAPAEQTDFILSWQTAYCFQPISIQAAVVIRQEGALFKYAAAGRPADAAWRIYLQDKGKWVPCGKMAHRPGPSDIESAFAAAAAVKSPITGAAKALRGLFDRGQK